MGIWTNYKNSNHVSRFKTWISWSQLSLKSYQVAAIPWIHSCESGAASPGGIFADEMGLGKTIVILGRIFTAPVDKTLIIVPFSLLAQWEAAVEKYILGINYRWLRRSEFAVYHNKRGNLEDKRLVLTTYGTVVSRLDAFQKIEWNRVVYDEAHHLRNRGTRLFKSVRSLKVDIQWFMTGTPIQNKRADFYALCYLLGMPDVQEVLSSRFLRRSKASVGLKLPPLREHLQRIPWKSEDEDALSGSIHATFMGSKSSQITSRLQRIPIVILTRARQMCVYPDLVVQAAKNSPLEGVEDMDPKWDILTTSKLDAVSTTLVGRKNNGRRKLVFCYYRREIDELATRLRREGLSVGIIDGRASSSKRKSLLDPLLPKVWWNQLFPQVHTTAVPIYEQVMNFIKTDVLLVQIQTACEGLNLQDFTEVYFTSPPWNPAVEDQAIARSHRLGQTQKVDVFRFIMDIPTDSHVVMDQYCTFVQDKKREIARKFLGLPTSHEASSYDVSSGGGGSVSSSISNENRLVIS